MPNPRVGESYYMDLVHTCDPYRGELVTITGAGPDIGGEADYSITFQEHPEWGTKWCGRKQLCERVPLKVPDFTSLAEAEAWLDANTR